MMNNYEWQKQYTKQRIDARLREAKVHRLAAKIPADASRRNPVAAVLWAVSRLFPARHPAAQPHLFPSEDHV